MDNVRAAVESLAQTIDDPQVRAAWLAYAAAQSERDANQDLNISDVKRSLASLRGELDAAIADAVRRALEGTEFRAVGFGALVDTINALSTRVDMMERNGEERTELLRGIMDRLDRLVPVPSKPVDPYESIDDPTGTDAGAYPNG